MSQPEHGDQINEEVINNFIDISKLEVKQIINNDYC